MGVNDAQGTQSNTYKVEVAAIDELGYRSILDVTVDVLQNEPPGLVVIHLLLLRIHPGLEPWKFQIPRIQVPRHIRSRYHSPRMGLSLIMALQISTEPKFLWHRPNGHFGGGYTIDGRFSVTFEVTRSKTTLSLPTNLLWVQSYLDVLANDSNFPDSDDSDGLSLYQSGTCITWKSV